MDAIQLLKSDHRKVEQLFQQAMQGGGSQQLKQLCAQIDKELTIHAEIEEKIFYPAVRQQAPDLIKEGYQEHGQVKLLLNQIAAAEPTSSEGKQLLTKLQQAVQHHVQEEENQLFPKVQQSMGQMLSQLGQQMQQAKQQAEPMMEQLGQQKLQLESMGGSGMSAQM
jgi:hemerythrin superfamily protein